MIPNALQRYEALQSPQRQGIFQSDTTSQATANYGAELEQKTAELAAQMQAMKRAEQESSQPQEPAQIDWNNMNDQQKESLKQANPGFDFSQPITKEQSAQMQGSMMGSGAPVTQAFGVYNPKLEPSKAGRNWGTDFGVKEGTPLALPPGKWEVVQAYSAAKGKGYIGNRENTGYGNSVLVRNPDTGETMRFSHLSGVNVQPGQSLSGGTIIGRSGATGNVTGAHLDLEYKDPSGQYRDIQKTQYGKYLFG